MKQFDFTNKNYGFPYSVNTLQFIQEQALQIQTLSYLGGNTYVVQGCTDNGSGVVSDGFVVIAGNIYPFKGGAVQPNVVIVPVVTTASFGDTSKGITQQIYPYTNEAYATFGSVGTLYAWADFENKDIAKGMLQRLREAEESNATNANDIATLAQNFNNYQPAWADIINKPSGLISYAAIYTLPQNGDIGGGVNNPSFPNAIGDNDSIYTISIPNQGTSNYVAIGTLEGLSENLDYDNDVAFITGGYAADSFKIAVREISANTQHLRFRFIIVKI